MSQLTKFEEQKQELDYFKALSAIAVKGSKTPMSQEEVMNIMLTARDHGISPMKAINGGFHLVKGKISMSTTLMTDRIRREGHSIRIPEWTHEKCVVLGVRKDNGDSIKFEYTLRDASLAGLTSSETWKKFPKQMLYSRAMSTLARTLFPDVVGNCYSEDEKWDIANVPPKDRPIEDAIEGDIIEVQPHAGPSESDHDQNLKDLVDHLEHDGLPVEKLPLYLEELCRSKSQPIEKIVFAAITPQLYERFKKSYSDWISLSESTN